MRSYQDMARELAFALPDEVLTELAEMLDGDRDDRLLEAVNEIVAKRHPELFASGREVVPDADVRVMFERAAAKLAARGPDRVLVGADGEAVAPTYARVQRGIEPVVVFLRKDGWMLGAPSEMLEYVAYAMWPDEWIGFRRHGEGPFRPIAEYKKAGGT
jgi:hypothetical protein